MEKEIKFNPLTTAAIIILVIVIIVYCLSRSPFEGISEKISELRKQIDRDVSQLNLAEQTQKHLMSKAQSLFKYLTVAIIILFLGVNAALINLGASFLDALEGTTLIVTMAGSVCSIIVFNKISVNALLDMAQKRVLLWVYRRNGFDPSVINLLNNRITNNESELYSLKFKSQLDTRID